MELYPTTAMLNAYSTNNPTVAIVGCLVVIVIIAMLFCLYDRFVRQEFVEKQKLLEAKRTFVRFVSHEVRTPLNTVALGVNLRKCVALWLEMCH